MNYLEKLQEMRRFVGPAETLGLDLDSLKEFASEDPTLIAVIDEAYEKHMALRSEQLSVLKLPEARLITELQEDFVNFYAPSTVNPYIALCAKGPWIISLHGAVIHDSGGYGMLGFGQDPEAVGEALGGPQVMANVMTPNLMQKKFADLMKKEIGHTHAGSDCPYSHFLCLNSGSEAVTIAARISDINAKIQTDPGGPHEGKTIKFLSMEGSFHGRTDRPAQASSSTAKATGQLASFRDRQNLLTVKPNDIEGLKAVFSDAARDNVFIEMMLIEPVMGEGDPGKGLDPEFYAVARDLTKKHGGLLLIDSIQAGLRAHGVLSFMDYPGFNQLPPPDFETFSKALNAGQFPLSVLACTQRASELYRYGVYGNTMTTNPRGLAVACAVLQLLTPQVRQNICDRGQEFVTKLTKLAEKYPEIIERVQGTGLLFAVSLREDGYKVVGYDGLEQYLRKQGIGVIHGGKNALRYTPHFMITSMEVDLIVRKLDEALARGPVYR